MLIILEGPDGAGKTSLAEEIKKVIAKRWPTHKIEIWKKGPPISHPLNEYEWPLLDYKPNAKHHIILDRWHVGEWVYPSYLNRDSFADIALWRHIEMFLQAKGAVMCHVSGHPDHLQRVIAQRGDALIPPHFIRGITQTYGRWMSTSRLPQVAATRPDKASITAHTLVGKGHIQEQRYETMSRYTTVIGSYRPNILFLGDVRNRVNERDPRTPVFMPYLDTSGHFLLKQTTSLFRDAAIANACDVDNLADLWRDLDHPQVVALGRNAWNCARNTIGELPVIGIPHPQYIRRFHNRAGDEWIEAIRQGLIHKEDMITWRPL